MVLCNPYEARARRSERGHHMRGRAGLRSDEMIAALVSCRETTQTKPLRCFRGCHHWQPRKQRKGFVCVVSPHEVRYSGRIHDCMTSSSAKESAPRSLLDSDLHRACALLEAQPRRSEMEMKTRSCTGHTLPAPWNPIRKHPPRSSERSEPVSLRKANGREICHG